MKCLFGFLILGILGLAMNLMSAEQSVTKDDSKKNVQSTGGDSAWPQTLGQLSFGEIPRRTASQSRPEIDDKTLFRMIYFYVNVSQETFHPPDAVYDYLKDLDQPVLESWQQAIAMER